MGWDDCSPVYYANENNPRQPSIYISLEPYNNGRLKYDSVLSITGKQEDAWIKNRIELMGGKDLGFDNAPYFNKLYGHQEHVYTRRVSEASVIDNGHWQPGSSPVIAHAGATRYWDRVTGDYTKMTEASGFFPTAWYGKGLRSLLNGRLEKAPAAAFDTLIK